MAKKQSKKAPAVIPDKEIERNGEKSHVIPDDKQTAAFAWLESERDYSEGVAIVQKFAPRNRILIDFLLKHKGHEIAKSKLLETINLWTR